VSLHLFIDIYVLLVGLAVGSYLNVVIYRLPREISTVLPRSSCPECGSPIRALDNLPLLSFLLLGGRCRQCRAPIARRYPLVEALTGLLFVACFERFGVEPAALAAALFGSLMIVLAAIDVEHLLLPDRITLPGILVGLVLQPLLPWSTFLEAILGTLVGAGLLVLLAETWYWLREQEGIGLGDVKMLALIGSFLGWKGVLVTLFGASLAGAVTGLVLMALGKAELRSKLPFGAFLALGGLISLFFGQRLAEAYLAGL
jgi:leader peptidase (prepilin peptidase)/N-methyltransferase